MKLAILVLFFSTCFAADFVLYCTDLFGLTAECSAVETRLLNDGHTVDVIDTPGLGSSLASASTIFLDFVVSFGSDCGGYYTATDIAIVKDFISLGGNFHLQEEIGSSIPECWMTKNTEFVDPYLASGGPFVVSGASATTHSMGSALIGDKADVYSIPNSLPAATVIDTDNAGTLSGVSPANALLVDTLGIPVAAIYDETDTTTGSRIVITTDISSFTQPQAINFQENFIAFLVPPPGPDSVAVADQVSLYFPVCIEWDSTVFTSPTVDILARADETELTVASSVNTSLGSLQWTLYGFLPGTEVEIVVQNSLNEGTDSITVEPVSNAIFGDCQNSFE